MSARRLLAALTLSLLFSAPALAQTEETKTYDWVLVYYMAYDNNLEGAGQPILDMLQEGITSDKVAVVVSADFRDTDGMHRYVLTQEGRTETTIPEEGSAEEETLAKELDWAAQQAPAKKYGLVFLDHGGGLGQMSYDEHPGKEGGQDWLYPPEVGKVVSAWRKKVSGEVELFFYQQCGKGSLENYHAMKDAARYVMGSQTNVGAPNRYYAKTVEFLGEHPEADGLALAKAITDNETPDMFTTYTTLDMQAAQDLPEHLDNVLKPLLALEKIELPLGGRDFHPCFDFGRAEVFFDGIALLEGLYKANKLDEAPLDAYKTWSQESLVVNHRVSPQQQERAEDWCGYSILLPLHPALLKRYADYPLYQDSQLDELWAKLHAQHQADPEKAGAPR